MANKIAKNKPKFFGFSHSSFFSARLSLIIAIILLLASFGFLRAKSLELNSKYLSQNQPLVLLPTPTPIIPTVIPTPTTRQVKKQKPNVPTIDPYAPIVDEKTTWTYVPAGDRMSTPDELFEAMNNYRKAHGLSILQKNDTLCYIAQARAGELQQLGKLDSHAGFGNYAHSQKEFNHLSEVISGGVYPESGVHIVEWGFDRSLTGHKEAISNPVWQYGCGGVAGWFAVFIFGER